MKAFTLLGTYKCIYNNPICTRETSQHFGRTFVETCLVVIDQRHDRSAGPDGWGWQPGDAADGRYLANWIRSGRKLSGRFLTQGRDLAMKYARQIVAIRNADRFKMAA